MEKRYAIFDMDGTLVDSMGQWRALGREYLMSRGVQEGLEEVLAQTAPMTLLESAELFRRAFGLGGTAEEIAVFEDAPYAIRTAKAAGFYVLAVYDESGAARWEKAVEDANGQILDWRMQFSEQPDL